MRTGRGLAVVASVVAVAAVGLGIGLGVSRSVDDAAEREGARLAGGDPARGPALVAAYGCVGCHTIPGVRDARGLVGPPLRGLVERAYIAGVAANTADNLTAWIMHPRALSPRTAMPELGVSEKDARDIAAFLYTRR